ncbi:response regulator [Acuticoccus sp. MNP-M23]|uniref:response regulator n=1 Tax=Acuticoccus sp. MNP-M23 TaxID=3072793 RepID=UPI00281655B5|nr:response regulator [Acuticoccus sp. MNP-M23]WMS42201.1 response regulator [Acuticoccus sp. MNP-M23]
MDDEPAAEMARFFQTAIIVEDDALISDDLAAMCAEFGVRVLSVHRSADDATAAITRDRPDYVLMDVRIRGKRDGIDIANAVHAAGVESRIVYITASTEGATLDRIEADHPYRVLIKPIAPDDLAAALRLQGGAGGPGGPPA